MNLFKKKEKNVFTLISKLLTDKGIKFKRPSYDDALFEFDADVDGNITKCVLVCDVSNVSLMTFVAFLSIRIPDEKLPEVFELIARINRLVWYGSFQINFEGDLKNVVRCKTTLPIDKATISYEQIERLCFNNLLHVHTYQNCFSKVIYNNVSPKDAL